MAQGSGRRHPVARHGTLTSPRPWRQVLAIGAVALAVVLVSAVGVAGFAAMSSLQTLNEHAVDLGGGALPPDIGEIEGGANILLVGTDSCEGQDVALFPRCAHDTGGERNDVTMLVHLSDSPRRLTVVSFPRDMVVSIPSCPSEDGGSYAESTQKLNSSYVEGGLACSVLTIEELTGVDIQFAGAVRWTGVINISDAIGGVEVCVADDIDDAHTGLHLKAGMRTLVGEEALQFLRIRHGIADGSDLGRISNQQQFMSSLVRKLQGEGVLSDTGTLFRLAGTVMQQVDDEQLVLDTNLANPTVMVQLALAIKGISYDDIVFVQYPTGTTAAGDLVPIRESAAVLFDALAENRALTITGSAGIAGSQEVVGEATPAPTATPGATSTVTPGASPTPGEDAVSLPDDITGQTPTKITCTQKERG